MAIFQALINLLGRSAGKILNAIFVWAVVGLFGHTDQSEQTKLSALVGAAVAWPLLFLGVIVPRIGTLILAFVPVPKWVPEWIIRLVWLVLALLVPIAVGIVVAAKAPPPMPRESIIKRVLRGFPITIALAAAFALMFVTVPILRIASAINGRKDETLPLM